jgi:membrane protease YdiL (CAAX protease family)
MTEQGTGAGDHVPPVGAPESATPVAPPDPLRSPPPLALTRFFRTRGGAVVLSVGAIGAYLVLGQGLPACLLGLVMTVMHHGEGAGHVQQAVVQALPYLLLFGVGVAVVLALALRLSRTMPPPPPRPEGHAALRLAAWVVGATGACLLAQLGTGWLLERMGHVAEEQEMVLELLRSPDLVAWAALVVGAPVAEEIVFRRIVHCALRGAFPLAWAYAATAVAFAAIHFHLPLFPQYLIIATACAFAYERTGRLAAPILVHALNNAAVVVQSQMG